MNLAGQVPASSNTGRPAVNRVAEGPPARESRPSDQTGTAAISTAIKNGSSLPAGADATGDLDGSRSITELRFVDANIGGLELVLTQEIAYGEPMLRLTILNEGEPLEEGLADVDLDEDAVAMLSAALGVVLSRWSA